jgi:hypothetical protein
MTDRELLELAAKAAGLNFKVLDNEVCIQYLGAGYEWEGWNPRNNNADAFALAVKLCMNVNVYQNDTRVTADDVLVCEYHGADPEGATRRAIVRAAAEMGEV